MRVRERPIPNLEQDQSNDDIIQDDNINIEQAADNNQNVQNQADIGSQAAGNSKNNNGQNIGEVHVEQEVRRSQRVDFQNVGNNDCAAGPEGVVIIKEEDVGGVCKKTQQCMDSLINQTVDSDDSDSEIIFSTDSVPAPKMNLNEVVVTKQKNDPISGDLSFGTKVN